ncbi:PEP-CTERM sorting domain-containing protein [Ruficoccus amylovorans]|uniref:PEP-CTERM sorting domain-containing protein n=1 Tax=Ruficoccus amylovorans TaxID=1804625 RepID=A0A842HGC4_9BACT|nr:PEP-CTERM sorting domain-containing protein [Ruficoccus amylovorans]MBC2595230.1 PEP-CTERM sorting domain-containing protein [Ruficoccus amylovorans]
MYVINSFLSVLINCLRGLTHGRRRRVVGAAFLACAACCALPGGRAGELSNIPINGMYMAYFNLDTETGALSWTNEAGYNDNQVLKPLAVTNPGDYFASGSGWASLLNPPAQGGQGAAFSRLFGFSLSGDLRTYLESNDYSIAIQLDSITYGSGALAGEDAGNTSVYYFNAGSDDWGTANAAKEEWSELTGSTYLIWNGQSFSNMVHVPVITTDTFSSEYLLSYTLSIVYNMPEDGVNATVVNSVTTVDGITPLTISYSAYSQVPEPATYAMLGGVVALACAALMRRLSAKS